MKCFACNKEMGNDLVCPHCGYNFTIDEAYMCPNCDEGVCTLTENFCTEVDFIMCPVKQEAEKYSF